MEKRKISREDRKEPGGADSGPASVFGEMALLTARAPSTAERSGADRRRFVQRQQRRVGPILRDHPDLAQAIS